MSISTENIIALSLINGVGSSFIKRNISAILSSQNSIEDLSRIGGKVSIDSLESNLNKANSIIRNCQEFHIEILTIVDPSYPKKLFEIKDPPPVLYLKGDKSLIEYTIGIIGTRKSSELGNRIANKIGQYFCKNWSICNGLVEGIDKNAVFVNNSILPKVTGVISGGLNFEHTSSKMTQELAKKVLDNYGLLISENEPDKKEDQFSGSKASRIQAGLSDALILVQSSKTGGSKYTIKTFSELNRTLGVVEYLTSEEYSQDKSFEANRLIIEKKSKGIIEMCEIKKSEAVKLSSIVTISKLEDYHEIENAISKLKVNNRLL